MLTEKIVGSDLLVVCDALTGLHLDCSAEYTLSCTVNVIDEEIYKLLTTTDSLNGILSRYIGACFGMCMRQAFPSGIEYENLLENAQAANDVIKEQTAGILESCGLAVEEIRIDDITLGANEKSMIDKMRSMKLGSF